MLPKLSGGSCPGICAGIVRGQTPTAPSSSQWDSICLEICSSGGERGKNMMSLPRYAQVLNPQHLRSGGSAVLQPVVITDSAGYQHHERFHMITLICIPAVKSRNGSRAKPLGMATDSSGPCQPHGCHLEAPWATTAGKLAFTAASPFCCFYWKEVQVQKVFTRRSAFQALVFHQSLDQLT